MRGGLAEVNDRRQLFAGETKLRDDSKAIFCHGLLTPALLYLPFRLNLSGMDWMRRWDCPAACRRQGSGANELVALWHWFEAKCVRSLSRSCLCPKLEPLKERPSKASSYVQEGARTL